MNAKVKATGELIEIIPFWNGSNSSQQYQIPNSIRTFSADELEFYTKSWDNSASEIISKQIKDNMDEAKWEQRT